MELFNIAGCSTVVVARNLGVDKAAWDEVLSHTASHFPQSPEAITKYAATGDYEQKYAPRCLIVAIPNGGFAYLEKIAIALGGYVLENFHSAHNEGRGMNIWLIPGKAGVRLYEGTSGQAGAGFRPEPTQEKQITPVLREKQKKLLEEVKSRLRDIDLAYEGL